MLKIKVANIILYTIYVEKTQKRFRCMKLSKEERLFVEELCHLYSDEELSIQLSRIRIESGIRDSVTIDQVRKTRYRAGIRKQPGRGKCELRDDD